MKELVYNTIENVACTMACIAAVGSVVTLLIGFVLIVGVAFGVVR